MTIYKVTDTKTDVSIYCKDSFTAFNTAAVMLYNKPSFRSSSLKSLADTFSENDEYGGIKIEQIYVIW